MLSKQTGRNSIYVIVKQTQKYTKIIGCMGIYL